MSDRTLVIVGGAMLVASTIAIFAFLQIALWLAANLFTGIAILSTLVVIALLARTAIKR